MAGLSRGGRRAGRDEAPGGQPTEAEHGAPGGAPSCSPRDRRGGGVAREPARPHRARLRPRLPQAVRPSVRRGPGTLLAGRRRCAGARGGAGAPGLVPAPHGCRQGEGGDPRASARRRARSGPRPPVRLRRPDRRGDWSSRASRGGAPQGAGPRPVQPGRARGARADGGARRCPPPPRPRRCLRRPRSPPSPSRVRPSRRQRRSPSRRRPQSPCRLRQRLLRSR